MRLQRILGDRRLARPRRPDVQCPQRLEEFAKKLFVRARFRRLRGREDLSEKLLVPGRRTQLLDRLPEFLRRSNQLGRNARRRPVRALRAPEQQIAAFQIPILVRHLLPPDIALGRRVPEIKRCAVQAGPLPPAKASAPSRSSSRPVLASVRRTAATVFRLNSALAPVVATDPKNGQARGEIPPTQPLAQRRRINTRNRGLIARRKRQDLSPARSSYAFLFNEGLKTLMKIFSRCKPDCSSMHTP